MKKVLSISVAFLLLIGTSSQTFTSSQMIKTNTETGVVKVQVDDVSSANTLVLIEKEDERYIYPIKDTDINQFPLQLGNGDYIIRVMQNVIGNSYKQLSQTNVTLDLEDSNRVFLESIQGIEFDDSSIAIMRAKFLTKGLSTDEDKVKAIYDYVCQNIEYDDDKAETVSCCYFPDVDSTYTTNKGICYDYASLLAAMLRGIGIPTKMIKGYSKPTKELYHAWNEVFVDGMWKIIDTTVDSVYVQENKSIYMYKSSKDYNGSKVY